MPADVAIRPFEDRDWPAVWRMLRETFAGGDAYVFPPETTEAEARRAWIDAPLATFVAQDPAGAVVGTYYVKPNQPGLGAHVCNCGYVVAREAEGRGIAASMCGHSQRVAVERGFRAMQFNVVVSTNVRAVALWKRLGFEVVGTLPGAFAHRARGDVDAYVMYKRLA